MRRDHLWFGLALALIAIASVVGFTRQQASFDEHKHLAQQTCEAALANRRLVSELVKIEQSESEHLDPTTLRRLERLDARTAELIDDAHNCTA